MIIGKILIVIEVVRAARTLIKETHSDLKELKKASKLGGASASKKAMELAGEDLSKMSKVKCRKALVRKKMRDYR